MTERAHQLGTVTAVSGVVVHVQVDGSDVAVPLRRSALYTTPAIGHRVVLDVISSGDRVVSYNIS